jgi:hypothetical protein
MEGGAKGLFKAFNSFARYAKNYGHGATNGQMLRHRGGMPLDPVGIKIGKQREHIAGTPEFIARKARGQQGSAWAGDEKFANEHTWQAWRQGKPNPRNPRQRDYDFGYTTGWTEKGRPQTKVRVHMDNNGLIHGHPKY